MGMCGCKAINGTMGGEQGEKQLPEISGTERVIHHPQECTHERGLRHSGLKARFSGDEPRLSHGLIGFRFLYTP